MGVVVGYICGWGVVFAIVDDEKKRLGGKRERQYFLLFYYIVYINLLGCM